MKIRLENFLCYTNRTFEFGSEGLTLISGPSGAGKTSILRGIFFALFGEGSKLQSYGKSSAKVELDFDNMKIVRTKRPNRLVVNDTYEDKVAQEIINKKFGITFKTSGYIQQNNLTSFILKSPRDKLELLEGFSCRDIQLGAMKKRLKVELLRRRDDLTGTTSSLLVITKFLNETVKPTNIPFPLRCKKSSRDIAMKNEHIRHKNCIILISRAKKKREHIQHELVATKVLEAQLEDRILQIKILVSKEKELKNKVVLLGYNGNSELENYTRELKALENQQKLHHITERYEEAKVELVKMERCEQESRSREITSLKSELYKEYAGEELNEIIDDTKKSIRDFSHMRRLEKQMSKLAINSKDIEISHEDIFTLKEELQESKKKYRNLELAANMYRCPSCSKSLKLYNKSLVLCSNTHIQSSPEAVAKTKRHIEILSKKLESVRDNVAEQEHCFKHLTQLQEDHRALSSTYIEDKVNLETLNDDLDYLLDYRASQKSLSKKIRLLESDEKCSQACRIFRTKVQNMREEIETLRQNLPEKLVGLRLGLDKNYKEEKQRLDELIEEQKSLRSESKSLEGELSSTRMERERHEGVIKNARENHVSEFKKVRLCKAMETLDFKFKEEIKTLLGKLEVHANNLEKIRVWKIYNEKQKAYNDLQRKAQDFKKKEKEARQRYGSVMTLKEKILEAESIAMLHIIETINTHACLYLDVFFPDNPISVQLKPFKTTKKSVKPSINVCIEYKGMECNLLMLSGGELSRVVLAFTLALAEIFNTPLLLLDECTASLDEEMTTIVISGIRNNFNGKLTLVIAHQVISGTFDNVVSLKPEE